MSQDKITNIKNALALYMNHVSTASKRQDEEVERLTDLYSTVEYQSTLHENLEERIESMATDLVDAGDEASDAMAMAHLAWDEIEELESALEYGLGVGEEANKTRK